MNHNFYLDGKEETHSQITSQIASMYLEKFPRKLWYGINLLSSECDNNTTIYTVYIDGDSEEWDVLTKCDKIAREEESTLNEVLIREGYDEILDVLCFCQGDYAFDIVDSIDLYNPEKLTHFTRQELCSKGQARITSSVPVKLTDEEYKSLLVELIKRRNRLSVNMLTHLKPELAQRIMRQMTDDGLLEVPFVSEMVELKEIVKAILDPFVDILGLFKSNDPEFIEFMHKHQIVPESGYLYKDENSLIRCCLAFYGTQIRISYNEPHSSKSLNMESSALMEKLGLNGPDKIYPYMLRYYNTADGFNRIKADFADCILDIANL